MNKLEVGMYVRTKKRTLQPPQIAKIEKMAKDSGYKNQYHIELDRNLIPEYQFHIYQEDVMKASHNIIDLIEVGDIVDKKEVINVYRFDDGFNRIELFGGKAIMNKTKIKSIVTKEQFDAMKYEVE